MGEYLDRAETLLRDVVQSRDISTLVVLHHLRDLAELLDNLKLYDECRLTGNCALDLAEALGRRSLEFRHEQSETLALIAGLSVYKPRACTLFLQAVSIGEEVVANNPSHSNKITLLNVLHRAACWNTYSLGAHWLERAVQLMTKELPPTMVRPHLRVAVYHNYGIALQNLRKYASAIEAYHESISIRRILAANNQEYDQWIAKSLVNKAGALHCIGKYDDAIVAFKEALEIFTILSAHDPFQYREMMAKTLIAHASTLEKLNHGYEAAVVPEQAISLCRNLAQTGHEWTDILCNALHSYGHSLYLLGKHVEAALAYQESILLWRSRVATDSEHKIFLIAALHDIANSSNALGQCVEANTAAIEALEGNDGRVFEWCNRSPDFKSCFVCQRAITPSSPQDVSLPLPFLLANYSRPTEHPGAGTSLTPAETLKPTGETLNVSVHKRRQKFLGFFRRDRAQ